MANNNQAFRRFTEPIICPVDVTAQKTILPANFFTTAPGLNSQSFYIVNPNNFWIRLKGSGNALTGTGDYVAVTATTGWLFGPGFIGVFSSQFPLYLSFLSVTFQGLPAGIGVAEISYGGGA